MEGIIKLVRYNEVIAQLKFTSTANIEQHKNTWQKRYAKKYAECEIVIERTDKPEKKNTTFKKNGAIHTKGGASFKVPFRSSHYS